VVFTPDALDEAFGQQILGRVQAQGLEVELLKSNRLTGLRDPAGDVRATYRRAKNTLAVVRAPAGALRLQPSPRPTGSSTWPRAARPTASIATWRAASAGRPW
jgi:spore photoproduct lyase